MTPADAGGERDGAPARVVKTGFNLAALDEILHFYHPIAVVHKCQNEHDVQVCPLSFESGRNLFFKM